jgi:hypothetical protein
MLESQCAITFDGIMQRQFIKGLPEFDAIVTEVGDQKDLRTVYVTLAEDGRTLKLVFDRKIFNDLKVGDRVRFDLNGCKVGKEGEAQTLYVTNLKPFNVLKRKSANQ